MSAATNAAIPTVTEPTAATKIVFITNSRPMSCWDQIRVPRS